MRSGAAKKGTWSAGTQLEPLDLRVGKKRESERARERESESARERECVREW
jgi:hypothetical protein